MSVGNSLLKIIVLMSIMMTISGNEMSLEQSHENLKQCMKGLTGDKLNSLTYKILLLMTIDKSKNVDDILKFIRVANALMNQNDNIQLTTSFKNEWTRFTTTQDATLDESHMVKYANQATKSNGDPPKAPIGMIEGLVNKVIWGSWEPPNLRGFRINFLEVGEEFSEYCYSISSYQFLLKFEKAERTYKDNRWADALKFLMGSSPTTSDGQKVMEAVKYRYNNKVSELEGEVKKLQNWGKDFFSNSAKFLTPVSKLLGGWFSGTAQIRGYLKENAESGVEEFINVVANALDGTVEMFKEQLLKRHPWVNKFSNKMIDLCKKNDNVECAANWESLLRRINYYSDMVDEITYNKEMAGKFDFLSTMLSGTNPYAIYGKLAYESVKIGYQIISITSKKEDISDLSDLLYVDIMNTITGGSTEVNICKEKELMLKEVNKNLLLMFSNENVINTAKLCFSNTDLNGGAREKVLWILKQLE